MARRRTEATQRWAAVAAGGIPESADTLTGDGRTGGKSQDEGGS
jgi:hypothetical protein